MPPGVLRIRLASAILLERIVPNPFNSRVSYTEFSVASMADSLDRLGLLTPVSVRPSPRDKEKYELVYGHRRFLAAKRLGWKSILADIVEITDEQMAVHSLTENFQRDELSDYEKARTLDVLVKNFGMTYEQIGSCLGITRQTVCNYLAILRLFDTSEVSADPELEDQLERITEHHARVLSHVEDPNSRKELVKLVAKENLSVRELQNIVNHLRSWFQSGELRGGFGIGRAGVTSRNASLNEDEAISKVIRDSYETTRTGDFERFKSIHMFQSGYTLFSGFASTGLEENGKALLRERKWFYEIAPKLDWKISNLRLTMLKDVAICTFMVAYWKVHGKRGQKTKTRGTVVLIKIRDSWRIFHEHYSPVGLARGSFRGKDKPYFMPLDSMEVAKKNPIRRRDVPPIEVNGQPPQVFRGREVVNQGVSPPTLRHPCDSLPLPSHVAPTSATRLRTH